MGTPVCEGIGTELIEGTSGRVEEGDRVGPLQLETIRGREIRIPDPDQLIHLQFRRYVGCPVCHLHLRTMAQRHESIEAAGILEVVVFHSSATKMRAFEEALPFPTIADPRRTLYTQFGVGQMGARDMLAGLPNLLDPGTWRNLLEAFRHAPSLRAAPGRGEEHRGLPADFLIGPDGTVEAVHYGRLVDDHWTVDTLLDLAATPHVR